MMNADWDGLLDATSLAALLPAEHAHFARPVRDGLVVFLGGLGAAEQADILRAQATLPLTATLSERLGRLSRSSPVLHKLGQVLARDQRLAPELRWQLRQLESLAPTVPLATAQRILDEELGPLQARGVTLRPPAIAEASVAIVIPFEQADSPPDLTPRHGVFKVLKPGIDERLRRELALLEGVGEYFDQRCDELRIPHLDYQESFQQVREKLVDEVQLENEQRHLVEARAFFADELQVQIPELLEHCTSRVTAMERIWGRQVTDHALDRAGDRRELADLVARMLIAKPIFSAGDRALFHGDPHAGNLFLTDDGRLAILDWSLVGRLRDAERIAIVQMLLGAMTLDANHIVATLVQLDQRQRLDAASLRTVVAHWLRRIRYGCLPGLSWIIGLMDDATRNARLRVGSDMMLFRKTLHTLEGVVADVRADRNEIDRVVLNDFLQQMAIEWPQRWLRPPLSRDFATRLSNYDLIRTLMSYPTTAARFWTGHVVDILDAAAGPCELETTCRSNP